MRQEEAFARDPSLADQAAEEGNPNEILQQINQFVNENSQNQSTVLQLDDP